MKYKKMIAYIITMAMCMGLFGGFVCVTNNVSVHAEETTFEENPGDIVINPWETTRDNSEVEVTNNIEFDDDDTTSVAGESTQAEITTANPQEIIKVAKVKVKKATKKKSTKKLVIKIKKVKGAKGYQVKVYTKKKNAKKNKKAIVKKTFKKNKKKLIVKNKKLQNKKKLFVKVRAYKLKANGKKKFGKWSKVKRVKIKS